MRRVCDGVLLVFMGKMRLPARLMSRMPSTMTTMMAIRKPQTTALKFGPLGQFLSAGDVGRLGGWAMEGWMRPRAAMSVGSLTSLLRGTAKDDREAGRAPFAMIAVTSDCSKWGRRGCSGYLRRYLGGAG